MGFLSGIEWKTVIATLVVLFILGLIIGRR